LQLQYNSALGVEVNPKAYPCTLSFEIQKIWLYIFRDDVLVSTLITTVESNLRTSSSWNTICIKDWAFTKPSIVRPRFLPYHAYPT